MMHGVYLLKSLFTDTDLKSLERVLVSESNWLAKQPIKADPWGKSGNNCPESNLWKGTLLWRTTVMYPQHPQAKTWRLKTHRYLINSISIPADQRDETIIAGQPIKHWFRGANFFPHFALDHHSYFNVGYMIICLSQIAILHFDLKSQKLPLPESLYHHARQLWEVVRMMVFSDGRLARIGGDSRLRYTYCQEYLLPVLLLAANLWNDEYALFLINQQLNLIQQEAEFNSDGSFYGKRLTWLAQYNPYYYIRLETDRACVLSMLIAWEEFFPSSNISSGSSSVPKQLSVLEKSASGLWWEPEYGAILHRSPTRLASFAWRAYRLAQGLCVPPSTGDLAEWEHNLTGKILFTGQASSLEEERKLKNYQIQIFKDQKGFLTIGSLIEGRKINLAEGWQGDNLAIHQIAWVALPDDHTVVGLQLCRANQIPFYLRALQGLQLNIPNDLFNNFERKIFTTQQVLTLKTPAPGPNQFLELNTNWLNVDQQIGVIGIYGAKQLIIQRATERTGGKYRSLYIEQICWPGEWQTRWIEAGSIIWDIGWAISASVSAETTESIARSSHYIATEKTRPPIRGIRIKGADDYYYAILVNFHHTVQVYPAIRLLGKAHNVEDLVTGEKLPAGGESIITLNPHQIRVFRLQL